MAEIPSEIANVCDFLAEHQVRLSEATRDGRINSSMNEDEILNRVEKRFDIIRPQARAWYDFAIESRNGFFPINIKVTDTNHADNLNCKLGIYYALTGFIPSFRNEIAWLPFFERLHRDFGKNTQNDYYFLIVNKQNPSDVFATKLKGLQTIVANGNNLPFQCCWQLNRKIKERSFKEATQFILSTFGESIKLRADIYFNFKRLFPEYV